MAVQFRFHTQDALMIIRQRAKDIDRAQRRLFAAHREAGDLAAEQFARVLEEKVWERAARTGYPPRETAHLRRALRDPRNAPVGASQINAGNPSWLDRSPARPYWRNLDQGTSVHVGAPVFVFGGPGTPTHTRIRDARNSPHRWRATLVQNPIEPYNFMEEGAKRAERVIAGQMVNIYRRHIPGFLTLFTQVHGNRPPMGAGGFRLR